MTSQVPSSDGTSRTSTERGAERLDHETEALKLGGGGAEARSGLAVELDHLRDEEDLAGDAAIGERPLQPLIDEALMRGVLIDDDQRVLGLGDDEGVVDLRARRAERIGGAESIVLGEVPARIGARLSERRERRLGPLGEAEAAVAETCRARCRARKAAPCARAPLATARRWRGDRRRRAPL